MVARRSLMCTIIQHNIVQYFLTIILNIMCFRTCQALGKQHPKLVYLDLDSCTLITNQSLKAIGNGCPKLEYLNISWCDKVSTGWSLLKFSLSRTIFSYFFSSQLTDDGVSYIARGCPKMKAFICKGCTWVIFFFSRYQLQFN